MFWPIFVINIFCIFVKISLFFQMNNKLALFQVMVQSRTGDRAILVENTMKYNHEYYLRINQNL